MAEQHRRYTEEMERQRILTEQQELWRRRLFHHFHARYPKLSEQEVYNVLLSVNWSDQLAEVQLNGMEQARQNREEMEKRQQQERDRNEEERRIREVAERIGQSELESMIKDANSWDQLADRFYKEADHETTQDISPEEQHRRIDLCKGFVSNLDDEEIQQVLSQHQWDLLASVPMLQEMDMKKFREVMKNTFTALHPNQVDDVVQAYYPDVESARVYLANVSNQEKEYQLLEGALMQAKARLAEAVRMLEDLNQDIALTNAKRLEKQAQLAQLPPEQQAFLRSVHENHQIKEDEKNAQIVYSYTVELHRCQNECQAAQRALEESQKQSFTIEKKVDATRRLEEIENKIAQYKKEREKEELQQYSHKKSVIVEKLKRELGQERFAVLSEAIGRAPGGVARRFDATVPLTRTSSTRQSGQIPPAAPPVTELEAVMSFK
eukprot:TRINITY_DN7127_c0_g1_i20.p1 TRINITY_DN7127_c0_g1~~TRINITY_DN7127_c0_g1_i20.p1  ORF type:complete len:437 (+),score=96.56 TRINITY_DN7127_c0_g1_i20:579-1889(+)